MEITTPNQNAIGEKKNQTNRKTLNKQAENLFLLK